MGQRPDSVPISTESEGSLPILANPQARSVFLTDGAREAEKVLDSPSTVEALEDATLTQLANALLDRIDKMSYTELRHLREDLDTPENHALTEARDQLADLCRLIASPSPASA